MKNIVSDSYLQLHGLKGTETVNWQDNFLQMYYKIITINTEK